MTATVADVHLSLPARAENVAVVRHVMGAFGEALALPRRRLEDVRLAVTEACTNVVRHAYDEPDGLMEITVHPREDRLEVVVADHGRGIGPSVDRAGPGLGLPMMATLCDELEIDRTVDSGSRVAMSFSRGMA
ncbi:MAG TPA: ATP-binding protein [Solirubrobacteraceae bacterium]